MPAGATVICDSVGVVILDVTAAKLAYNLLTGCVIESCGRTRQ